MTAEGAEAVGLSMGISRELVGVMKDYLGRGPTRARTYVRDNLVVCVMQETMTKAERHMASDHGAHAVRNARRLFQDSIRDQSESAIERLTGRHVVSFMSDHDIENDYVSIVFVLEPQNGDGDSHLD